MVWSFFWGRQKCKIDCSDSCALCECTNNRWIVFKLISCMLCELYLNKLLPKTENLVFLCSLRLGRGLLCQRTFPSVSSTSLHSGLLCLSACAPWVVCLQGPSFPLPAQRSMVLIAQCFCQAGDAGSGPASVLGWPSMPGPQGEDFLNLLVSQSLPCVCGKSWTELLTHSPVVCSLQWNWHMI